MKGGFSLLAVLHPLTSAIWDTGHKPDQWREGVTGSTGSVRVGRRRSAALLVGFLLGRNCGHHSP